jgi:copper(I)-binding protein
MNTNRAAPDNMAAASAANAYRRDRVSAMTSHDILDGGRAMKSFGMIVVSLVAVFTVSGAASALDYKVGAIEIDSPWSRAVPKGAKVAAGYMTIKNTGTEPDRLVGGSTPVAGRFEIHEMSMDKGVMRMRPLSSGLEIQPGETVELKPSSFHIMTMDLKEPIQRGKPFKASLMFEKAGVICKLIKAPSRCGEF